MRHADFAGEVPSFDVHALSLDTDGVGSDEHTGTAKTYEVSP